jgi:hypothetical protein
MNDRDLATINKAMIDCGRFGGVTGAYSGLATGGPVGAVVMGTVGGALFGAFGAAVATVAVVADKISKS